MINKWKEKNYRPTVMVLLFTIAVTALGAGYGFMEDPSGENLGFSLHYIRFSPFRDFFWPGLILLVCIGIFASVCFLVVLRRYKIYPSLLIWFGLVLIGWILIQILMVRDVNLLHITCLIIGLLIFFTGRVLYEK